MNPDQRGPGSHLFVISELARNPDLVFRPFRPGVEAAWIYGEGSPGAGAALLRYAAGARVPPHRHEGYEHILVLEGSQQDERGAYAAGSLVINEPGSQHDVWTDTGCLVLVIWERRVQFLEST